MLGHEQYEYAVRLSKLRKQSNFLFIVGIIMTVILNVCLVNAFISSRFDLSLLILVMYVIHDLAFKNAMNGITENINEIKEKLINAEGEK